MVHDAGEISVGEGDAPERGSAQDFAGRGLVICAEEESGLRIQISVAPAIEDDAGNVTFGIETS